MINIKCSLKTRITRLIFFTLLLYYFLPNCESTELLVNCFLTYKNITALLIWRDSFFLLNFVRARKVSLTIYLEMKSQIIKYSDYYSIWRSEISVLSSQYRTHNSDYIAYGYLCHVLAKTGQNVFQEWHIKDKLNILMILQNGLKQVVLSQIVESLILWQKITTDVSVHDVMLSRLSTWPDKSMSGSNSVKAAVLIRFETGSASEQLILIRLESKWTGFQWIGKVLLALPTT